MSYEKFLSAISKAAAFRPKQSAVPGREGSVRWVLDEDLSLATVQAVTNAVILERGGEYALKMLYGAIDALTGRWQDYRSGISTQTNPPTDAALDQYALSWLLNQSYTMIIRVSTEAAKFQHVAIATISPGRADRGKNIVRLCWGRAGYPVLDMGINISAAEIIEKLMLQKVSALGIACTLGEARTELESLLASLGALGMDIPVVIGGIAADPDYVSKLGCLQPIPVYYCRDLHESVSILRRALRRLPAAARCEWKAQQPAISSRISAQAKKCGFTVWELSPRDLIVDSRARDGCVGCSTAKQNQCPLEKGWEKARSIQSSRQFIDSFDTVYLLGADIVDEANPADVLSLWNRQVEFQKLFSLQTTFLFRFPTYCPYCFPAACEEEFSHCRFPDRYLGLHETYNINLQQTLVNKIGGMGSLIYSVLLVKQAAMRVNG